jgi:hypothetical protein
MIIRIAFARRLAIQMAAVRNRARKRIEDAYLDFIASEQRPADRATYHSELAIVRRQIDVLYPRRRCLGCRR